MALGKLDIQKLHDDYTVIFEENNGSSYAGRLLDALNFLHCWWTASSSGSAIEDARVILAELDRKGRVIVDNVKVLENELTTNGMTNLSLRRVALSLSSIRKPRRMNCAHFSRACPLMQILP